MTILRHGGRRIRPQDWPLGGKAALVFASYTLAMLAGITLLAYFEGTERSRALARERLHGLTLAAESQVHEFVESIRQDTLTQAASPSMAAFVEALLSGDPARVRRTRIALEADFMSHAHSRPYVYQARVIHAETGRELLRVQRDPRFGRLGTAPVQDKGHRDYVEDMRGMAPGQLYVSTPTLNREGGRIEKPHRPTLRFGQVVEGPNEEPMLLLVLNVGFRHLMFRLRRLFDSEVGLMVFDGVGRVLSHPNRTLEFDFETGAGTTTVDLFGPAAALPSQIQGSAARHAAIVSSGDRMVGLRRVRLHPQAQRDIIVGASLDPDMYLASLWAIGERSWMLAGGLLAVGSLLFGVVGSILVRPVSRLVGQIDAYEPGSGGPKPGRRMLDRRDEFGTLARGVYGLALRSEAQMRAAKAARDEMRGVFQCAADAIVIIDEDGLIEDVNQAAEALFDWTRAELLGRRASILLVPEDRTLTSGKIGRHSVDDSDLSVASSRPSEAVRRDGSRVPVALSISQVGVGRGGRFVAIIHDMSNVFALEAARSASLAKTRFLANMSHELRTPLNAVVLHAEMISDEAQDVGNEQLIEDSGNIKDAARHLLDLINGILDLARIESGRTELAPETFDLETFVNELRSMAQALAVVKGNTVHIRRRGLPATIFGDRVKLRQCLLNLISNAAKFTEKGTITIEVDHRPVRLMLAVEDTGIGMTEEQMSRVFDVFEQAHSYIHGQFGGSGVGLALTRSLMELMGGTISVTSQPGKGTRFELIVPLEKAAAKTAAQPDTAAPDEGVLAMVVDADDEHRANRMKLLTDVGFRAIGAGSHRDAVERVGLHAPDFLVVDAAATDRKTGVGLRESLRADPLTTSVPVLSVAEGEDAETLSVIGPCGRARVVAVESALVNAVNACLGCGVDRAVMVVEDDAGMLRAIARAVEREGLPVVLFTNGDDALVYLRHSVPAAVLLDLSLPGGANGFDIIKALQATARLAMVPVFVVTGIDLTTAEEQWLIERTKDLVRKASMDFDTVMQAVVSAVEPAGSDCCLGRPAESKVFHALAQQKPEDDNTPRCAVAE